MTMGAEIGTDSVGVRRRYITVVITVVCLGLAGIPYSNSFAGHDEATDIGLLERVLDENGNLIATMADPSQTRREVSSDMLQTFGTPVKSVQAGQENLRLFSRDGPIPLGPPFLGEVPLYVNGSSEDTGPRIAHNPIDGYLWAVFSHNDGLDTDVYVSYSNDLGRTWNLTLSTTGPFNETNPAIAIAGNTIFIAYEQDNVGWEQNTFFIRSQDGGQSWGTYYIDWDWTNPNPGVQLEDFNNIDVSAVRPGWFHWIADVYAVKNATRTVAFMWTDTYGDTWSMAYWMPSLHTGEDLEHPVIMENSADEHMHMAWQRWNTTEAGWDIQWVIVDHGLFNPRGWWTAYLDGGNSEISPDLYVRDDRVHVVWQNGTSSSDLTGFYSDDGGSSTIYILFITLYTPSNEGFPSVTIDAGYVPHLAFSNDSLTYYATNSHILWQPWSTYVVSENSSTADQHRLLDLTLISGNLAVAWTDIRNVNADIYFSMAELNTPPVAVAKPLYQEVSVGETTWLYGNESYDPDGFIVNHSWSVVGPPGTLQLYGDIVSFVPTMNGLYDATLTVIDNGSFEDSAVVHVNVGPIEPMTPPIADAGGNKVVFMWEVVTFNGSGSYDPDGFIVDYLWDFGDGDGAGGAIVNHTYLEVGEYYVTLTVMDDDNLTDTDTAIVVVLDPRPDPPDLMRAILAGTDLEDVLVEWELSSDDGSGFDDVINYAVYWSDSYDSSGAGYHFLAELPPGTTSLTLAGWGDGDWSDYFVYVQANDTDGYTNWKGQAGKFVRFMEAGKRIASVPLVQDDETLETVLQSLDGSYNHVRYYRSSDQSDHWKSYWTFKTYRTLFEINHNMGFWIQITKDDHLVVAGLVPEVTEIQLGHEWNFVGYPCFFDDTVGGALSAIDWTKIDGYSDTPPYHLRHLSPADIMTAGEGYWIWVDVPQVWTVEN